MFVLYILSLSAVLCLRASQGVYVGWSALKKIKESETKEDKCTNLDLSVFVFEHDL